jgi:hypothetical protein
MIQEAERLRLLKEEELKQQRLQQEQEALRQQQLALQKQVLFFVNNSTFFFHNHVLINVDLNFNLLLFRKS